MIVNCAEERDCDHRIESVSTPFSKVWFPNESWDPANILIKPCCCSSFVRLREVRIQNISGMVGFVLDIGRCISLSAFSVPWSAADSVVLIRVSKTGMAIVCDVLIVFCVVVSAVVVVLEVLSCDNAHDILVACIIFSILSIFWRSCASFVIPIVLLFEIVRFPRSDQPIAYSNSFAGVLSIHFVYHQNTIAVRNQKIVVLMSVRKEIIIGYVWW